MRERERSGREETNQEEEMREEEEDYEKGRGRVGGKRHQKRRRCGRVKRVDGRREEAE